jgi:hypothetical protein
MLPIRNLLLQTHQREISIKGHFRQRLTKNHLQEVKLGMKIYTTNLAGNPIQNMFNDRIGNLTLNESVSMALDWTSNKVVQTESNYFQMMAMFQLRTDPFTNEIGGDLHPYLLVSKASQADNPTY